MPLSAGKQLREVLTPYLSRVRHTRIGTVHPHHAATPVVFGSPGGPPAQVLHPWMYHHDSSPAAMLFGFFPGRNRRGHDLICRYLANPDAYAPRMGASLQLNADHCYFMFYEHVVVSHHGNVSRPGRIAQGRLAALIQRHAPRTARALRTTFSAATWPYILGSTADLRDLLDRLFLYTSCIQVAKDALDAERA
mgnify:CR=1 FL=1